MAEDRSKVVGQDNVDRETIDSDQSDTYTPLRGFEPRTSALDRIVELIEGQKRLYDEQKRLLDEQKNSIETKLDSIEKNLIKQGSLVSETKESVEKCWSQVVNISKEVAVIEGEVSNVKQKQQNLEGRLESVGRKQDNFEEYTISEFQQLKVFNKDVIQRFSETDKTIQNLTTNVSQNIETCFSKIREIEDTTATKTFGSLNNNLWSSINVKTFTGDGNIHPVDFLFQIKDNFMSSMTDNLKVKFFKKYLDGEALSWANQTIKSDMSFVEVEQAFMNKFWSEIRQARIKAEFLNGANFRQCNGRMKLFCEQQLKKLVHLDKPLDEMIQIDALKKRLPQRVQWSLVYGPDDNIEEFLRYVDKLDMAYERNEKYNDRQNDSRNRNNRDWGRDYRAENYRGEYYGNNRIRNDRSREERNDRQRSENSSEDLRNRQWRQGQENNGTNNNRRNGSEN